MTEHTKEPWRVSGNGTLRFIDASPYRDGVSQGVATCNRVEHGDMEANARRIVACVNACAGLTTDYLETVGLPEFVGKTLCADLAQQELDRVTAQRDQLLAALELAEQFMVVAGDWNMSEAEINGEMRSTQDLLGIVRKAISAVKGDSSGNTL